ncbi:MAG TPA: chemotaxis protein CheA [Thermoanaerobaculia bacterium]|nr:chemotaxis protein CheA [Thermoanaerobaculia bacterium]
MSEHDLNQDELMATFLVEAEDDILALEAALLELEDSPDDEAIRLEALRRAHTLKGNASCVGLQRVADFAHTYEERLENLGDVDAALIAELLAGVDTFRRLVANEDVATESKPHVAHKAHVRVAAEKLNRMLDLAGEIAITRGRVQQMLATRAIDVDVLVEVERQTDQLQSELQELIMRARMVPIGPMFQQYARTVRDLAATHGKNARLVTIGDDVELDTSAVELLRDPLTHMIRNAIDHGLEPSADRVAKGKPAVGHITLEARHEAGSILIRISDDGAGLDRKRIAARAHALGIDGDLDRAIFAPGFTTAEEITDLSGRGVGMDVVRRGVETLRGTIAISTSEGEGTTFTIRLPLTLAVIDGFGVAAGDETYIVPMENVIECVELPADKPANDATGVLLLREEIVPYVRLRKLFALSGDAPARENVLVVQHDGARAGLVVDTLHGSAQAVIKPLGGYFAEVPGIAGSSILGSGRVALILDTPAILRNLAAVEQIQ